MFVTTRRSAALAIFFVVVAMIAFVAVAIFVIVAVAIVAVTVMAGLTFGTVLTLILVPVLYTTLYRLKAPA